MSAHQFTIVGLGEALFDVFPDRQVLGGAPLNVAVHAHQLASAGGESPRGRGVVVSRVGQDDLGDLVLQELRQRGMTTDFVQTDPDRDTGTVYVDMDASGGHSFRIVRDVAWDVLQYDFDIEDLAKRCDAVAFGTLAQRDGQTRNTIYRFLEDAKRAVKLFDVNLRQRYYDQRIIQRSCELSDIVKLNEHELPIICEQVGLAGAGRGEVNETDRKAEALRKKFSLDLVALTAGEKGTTLYTAGGKHSGEPVSYDRVDGADSVGAGDACTAGLLVSKVLRFDPARTVQLANHCGAYVASQHGATPMLPEEILKMVKG